MSLRSRGRLLIRMTVFVLAWCGALYARFSQIPLLNLAFGSFRGIDALWLLLGLDLALDLGRGGRWQGFPQDRAADSPQALSLLRRRDRSLLARALALWALLWSGGAALVVFGPLGPDAAVLATATLLPVEAVFVHWRCPIGSFLTHSRCCRTCRLRDWGEAMVLSPLLVVPSFFTAGLFALSLVILLRGERLRLSLPALLDSAAHNFTCCAACPERCGRKP